MNGPRLSQLTDLDSIVSSLKNGNYEYFIWKDATNLNISAFSGTNLLDTTLIGPNSSNVANPYFQKAFNDGILFTVSSFSMTPSGFSVTETTHFYNITGIEETLADTNIVLGDGSFADDGIYLAKKVNDQVELHLITGNTTASVKIIDLDNDYVAYNRITDLMQNTSTGLPVNTDGTMFFVLAVDFNNNGLPVYLAYNAQSLELIHKDSLAGMNNQTITTFTSNGVFVFSPMQTRVTRYSNNGADTFNNSFGIDLEGFDAYFIQERPTFSTDNTYFYYEGSSVPEIFMGEGVYIFENSIDKGLAFATFNRDRTSFKLHSFTVENGLVSSDAYEFEFSTVNNPNNHGGVISYQTIDEITANTTTHFIRYDQGWEFFHAYGDVILSYDALVMLDGNPYVVDVATITDSNRDNALISIYNGLDTSNDVMEIYLVDYDIRGIQIVGFAGNYMLMNVYNNTPPRTIHGQGLLINLSTGTIENLPEGISYLAPQLNETYSENIYFNNNIITAYKMGGAFSFDVTDIANTFTTISENLLTSTHSVWVNHAKDHFGENQDLVLVQETPYINPTNTSSFSVYHGDMSAGLDALTLLTTVEVEETFRNSSNLIITLEEIYVVSTMSNTITTLFGDVLPGFYYIQNGLFITFSDTYEETPTLFEEGDAIRI